MKYAFQHWVGDLKYDITRSDTGRKDEDNRLPHLSTNPLITANGNQTVNSGLNLRDSVSRLGSRGGLSNSNKLLKIMQYP